MAKKPNFGNKLALLIADATEFIKKNVKVNQTIVFATKKQLDEDEDGFVDELPNLNHVDKYESNNEYAIMAVEHKADKEIVLHVYGKGENTGAIKQFDIGYLSDSELLQLADEISTHLK